MDHSTITVIAEAVLMIVAFVIGYFITGNPNASKTILNATSRVNLIIQYADIFVSWAKQFMADKSGSEKMDEVVAQLNGIAEKYKIDISETELRAIVQKAYDNMKAGECARINDFITLSTPGTTENTVNPENKD